MSVDRNIRMGKNTMYFGAYDFANGIIDASGGVTKAMGTGTVSIGQFNSLFIGGWVLTGTTNIVSTILPIPKQWNVNKTIRWRVHFGHTSTDADAPVFTLYWEKQTDKAAGTISSLSSSAATAKTCTTTANSYHMTDWKAIVANTFTRNAPYIFQVTPTSLGSASSSELYLFGLEFEYYPSITGT